MRRGFLAAPQLLCIFNLVNRRKRHSPHIRVGCAFSLLLLHKEQDGIHMPRRLMDDLEGEIADEKFHECALGHDILSADLNGEDALLLNIDQYCAFGVAHNVGCLICGECIGKVAKPRFNVVSECFLALVRDGNVTLGYSHGMRLRVMSIACTFFCPRLARMRLIRL